MNIMHYIYILREREFVKSGESIYKVGKSKQVNCIRLMQYPKGSQLHMVINVVDCDCMEKKILKVFNNKFKLRRDIGKEYYEGNVEKMIDNINYIRSGRDMSDIIQTDKNIEKYKLAINNILCTINNINDIDVDKVLKTVNYKPSMSSEKCIKNKLIKDIAKYLPNTIKRVKAYTDSKMYNAWKNKVNKEINRCIWDGLYFKNDIYEFNKNKLLRNLINENIKFMYLYLLESYKITACGYIIYKYRNKDRLVKITNTDHKLFIYKFVDYKLTDL